MNILYIHTHDTGRYIQPYGYNIPMPNLMKLANEGTLFRNAYCMGPTCSPSRAALLTGMAPHSCGMLGLAHRGFGLNDYSEHLTQFLNRQGFETVLCGIHHEASDTNTIGYGRQLKADLPANSSFAEKDLAHAIKASEYLLEKKEKPFFLSFGMMNTHRPFPPADEDINPNYVAPPLPIADTKETREDMAGFVTGAKTVDKCIGIVLDALKNSGLEEDTFVFYTTDHGIAFPGMKCNLFDSGIGVSLVLKYPGNKRKGQAIDALVSHVDIFPTLCDLIGAEKPERLQGVSLLPLLEGEKEEVNQEIFAEVNFHAAYEPIRCIRTKRYKLIKYLDEFDRIIPANIDDSATKNFLVQSGLLELPREKEMLFDLNLDPLEKTNLIGHPHYKETYDSLSKRLSNWMVQTNDPLLNGKLEKPLGAKVNRRESLSATSNDFG